MAKTPGHPNKDQVRAAMGRFNQTDFVHKMCDPGKAKRKILRVARKLHMNVDKFRHVSVRRTHGRARR